MYIIRTIITVTVRQEKDKFKENACRRKLQVLSLFLVNHMGTAYRPVRILRNEKLFTQLG